MVIWRVPQSSAFLKDGAFLLIFIFSEANWPVTRWGARHSTNGITPSAAAYVYNYLGGVTALTNPSGRVINYSYDTAGRPLTATDATTGVNYVAAASYAP